jgi:sec-independent protein translocase protein TatA
MIANIFGPDLGIIIVVILVVLLGGSQLPKIARNVGTAGREFRKAQQEAEDEAEREKAAKAAREAANAPAGQLTAAPAPAAAPTAPAPQVTTPATQGNPGEESIRLTQSELEAVLKAREAQVRGEGQSN